MNIPRLHINVDHVATLRQARRGEFPCPIEWALAAEKAGAHGITCHLRKDRRHIQDADVIRLRGELQSTLNLELSLDTEMVDLALRSRADAFCLVPEMRQEVTTEGGLDCKKEQARLRDVIPALTEEGGLVSLFVDPEPDQLDVARELGAPFVELHTGCYANSTGAAREQELERLMRASTHAQNIGLRVNAGHGLDYENVSPVALMGGIEELNIGFAIVARAVFVGVAQAVEEMLELLPSQGEIDGRATSRRTAKN
jgi:pyridoxine 5-phosphate synthase